MSVSALLKKAHNKCKCPFTLSPDFQKRGTGHLCFTLYTARILIENQWYDWLMFVSALLKTQPRTMDGLFLLISWI
jgi:hypothetical protein